MKQHSFRMFRVKTILYATAYLVAFSLNTIRADEKVNAQLRALFPKYDSDRNSVLSQDEQAKAAESVKTLHGRSWERQVQALFKSAADSHGSVSSASWLKEVEKYGKQSIPPKQTLRIAMSDGIHLATDVYLPAGKGPFPVVLTRTPYGRSGKNKSETGERFTRNGCAYVVQDMRGRFDSEGESIPFNGCGWSEHKDGIETLAWIRKQPWCNGKIGTIGGSACGITQNLMAGATAEYWPDVQYINVAAASLYHDAAYVGGALRKCQVENWSTNNKFDPKAIQLMRDHPCYDSYWHQFDTTRKFAAMKSPAIHVGGWFDTFAQGTIDAFTGRQHQGGEGARGCQKLVMGPWCHSGFRKEGVGDLVFPNAQHPDKYSWERLFEYYLLEFDNGIKNEPAISYYTMGDTSIKDAPGNEWRSADNWPVPANDTAFYFHADKRLSGAYPAPGNIFLEYTFDPTNACPTIGGKNLTIDRGPRNQKPIESRSDVILFTSPALNEPVEVTGRVKAKIFIESSAVDSDLSVRLCDVYPDGRSFEMAEGMLRLRYRKSLEKPELLVPGKVEEATVDCWSTSVVFNKGHRIRVIVTSSNYPRFDVNPGTGQPWSNTGEKLKQTNRIHCSSERASCIILPVVAGKNVSK